MSKNYAGDFPINHTNVTLTFDSFALSTGAPAATSNFANTDVQIYKDGSNTQRSSSAGITVTTTFDTLTGLQLINIDLSDNTDAGFYAAGHEYDVAISDVTIDSQTMRFWVGSFSIQRAGGVLALIKTCLPTTIAPGSAGGVFIAGTNAATTVTTSFTTTFTGNLTGSVGSVTGAVGSITGGTTLTNAGIDAIFTRAITEAYSTDASATITLANFVYESTTMLQEKTVSSTTLTGKKRDGTTAMTFTLDSASSPTAITRAS